jgi:DNA-binding ferritin-like protein (Dps family)
MSRNYLYFQDKLGEDVFERYEGVRSALWNKGLKDSFLYIDGHKTVKEIYDAVQSELWSGGYTQRYRVSFEIMTEYFRLLKDAGIIFFME